MSIEHTTTAWGVRWHSRNKVDGVSEHLVFHRGKPAIFPTKKQAKTMIDLQYGYIRNRPDLRREPHGWRMPKAVRVTITVKEE